MSAPNRHTRGTVRLCYSDVYATWTQIIFCVVLVALLIYTTVDLLTTSYLLTGTEDFLAWLEDENFGVVVIFFIFFGAISIVCLLPQTVLFLGAGYLCSSRLSNRFTAFFTGLAISLVTFVLGATAAFLLARKVLPPSCTYKCFRHFRVLEGLDQALKHKGRRMNILLRINPLSPYNAINYGLGLTSCTMCNYWQGMIGSMPYMSIAVYAGMVIDSVQDVDSMFEHTSTAWICIYCAFGMVCIMSCVALVRYTAAEMRAVVESGRRGEDDARCAGRTGSEGPDRPEATTFGTFVAGGTSANGEEEMTSIGDATVREPLLTGDDRRAMRNDNRARGIRATSIVDV